MSETTTNHEKADAQKSEKIYKQFQALERLK